MKKLFAMLMCLALLLGAAGSAWAEEAVEDTVEAEYEFSFRGGIRWGMSMEEVRAVEDEVGTAGEEEDGPTEQAMGEWNALGYPHVPVSKYEADTLIYLFNDDSLDVIVYDFYTIPDDEVSAGYAYLAGALGSVYGELEAADKRQVLDILDTIAHDFYSEEDIRNCMLRTLPDGTLIYVYYYDNDSFCIMYVKDALDATRVGSYDTNGL